MKTVEGYYKQFFVRIAFTDNVLGPFSNMEEAEKVAKKTDNGYVCSKPIYVTKKISK